MPNFTGQLNSNAIFAALFNMIISQQTFADNFGKHQHLVDKGRVDGTLYGDTKLYHAVDVLKTNPWGGDAEATNLLALDRPPAPKTQAIELNVFRQIRLTVDDYLTKQAWSEEYAFSEFTAVMIAQMEETRKVYEGTLYNAFIGTNETSVGRQKISFDVTNAVSGLSGIEKDIKEATFIAKELADLITDMSDYNRDFNDYQYMRSYDYDQIQVVWNQDWVNKIRKVDTPAIFHKEDLIDKFADNVINARYFGVLITSSNISSYSDSTPAPGKPIDADDGAYTPGSNHANGLIRSAIELEWTAGGTTYHVFPGDELPSGTTIGSGKTFEPGEVYIEDGSVICKILVKFPPMMSAFSVGTSFFNARSLTENKYITFGHNTLEHFSNYPFVTIRKV